MSRTPTKRRGPMGGHGSMGMSVEKAKDFKGTMKTLWSYLSNYKFAIILVAVFAIGSTIFSIVGPKILGNATTELFNGLMDKLQEAPVSISENRGNPAVSDRPVCGQRFVQLYSGLYHDECVSKADLPLAEKYF